MPTIETHLREVSLHTRTDLQKQLFWKAHLEGQRVSLNHLAVSHMHMAGGSVNAFLEIRLDDDGNKKTVVACADQSCAEAFARFSIGDYVTASGIFGCYNDTFWFILNAVLSPGVPPSKPLH